MRKNEDSIMQENDTSKEKPGKKIYRNKKDKLRIEKRILQLSFLGSLLFIVAEGVMALVTHSHSLLTDCLFDAADLVMVGPLLVLVPLLYKPVTEKHPYGYAQVESLFLLIKYSVLLALTCNLMVENIKLLWHGGHEVDAGSIAVFEFLVCVGCVVMYLVLNHYSKKYESTTIRAELFMWKLDIVSSMGVAIAFVVQMIMNHTRLAFLTPYIDPAVAVVMALLLIREPVKVIFQSIKNLVLFAPEEGVLNQIRSIVDRHMQDYPYEVKFLDVIQTGRKLWIEVYIGNQTDVIHISILHRVRDEIKEELKDKYDQVYIEVIPD